MYEFFEYLNGVCTRALAQIVCNTTDVQSTRIVVVGSQSADVYLVLAVRQFVVWKGGFAVD